MAMKSLNHVYRLIWNEQKQAFIAVAETNTASGKRASRMNSLCISALLSVTPITHALELGALPTDGQIVAGNGSISQTHNQMTITQNTDRMVTNWSNFNIGEQARVDFQQPNAASIALNRIINSNPSEILGTLSANGQVYLINPNGILFGRTAQVNAGGIVASTLDMSNEAFLNPQRTLSLSGNTGHIENQGTLSAEGAVIALIAPTVTNSGDITTTEGSALLAAGNQITLDFAGDGLVSVKVDKAAFNALAENKGLIQADGGLVMMTAKSANALMDTVVNQEGIIQANTLVTRNGRIILDGGDTGITHLTGDIEASGIRGGDVIVTGHNVGLFDEAHINVNGQFGGGNIFIGGGQEGKDPTIHNAKAVHISQDSALYADASEFGKGGTLIAYSTESTQVHGHLSARGGSNGGDGGFIETSGGWLDISKAPNTSSDLGNGGTWLIDPYNITIASGNANTNINSSSPFSSSGDGSSLGVNLISTALNSGDVSISTGAGGSQGGDITWNVGSTFTYSAANARTLTLTAHRDIILNDAITSTNGALTMAFNANSGSSSGTGGTIVKNNLTTNGGNISFTGVGTIFSGSSAQTLATSNGNITFGGEILLANTNGVTFNTGNGNVSVTGIVNSGNTYTYDSTTRTWTAARTAAINAGGYLANVTTALEQSAINAVAGTNQYWLGGSDLGTEGTWKWMDGPEADTTFWVSGTNSTGATGYNGYNGAYVNWNSGEPNDSGSAEDYLQGGFNNAGLWNDLGTSSSLGSVVETNLAASPLTITAGTGTVTLTGAVGTMKALNALNITASTIAINGGSVTTEGLQTYAGDVTIGATTVLSQTNANTNFTLAANKSITKTANGTTTLTIKTTQDIIFASGSRIGSTTPTGTGPLNISLNPRSAGGAIGSLVFNNTSSTGVNLYSNGGNITFAGGSNNADYAIGGNGYGLTQHKDGAYLHTVTLDTRAYVGGSPSLVGGGNISIKSKGYAGVLDMPAGGLWTTGSTFTTGGGDVTLETSGQRTSNAANNGHIRYGAYLEGLVIITENGAISITTPEEEAAIPDTGMYLVSSPSFDSGSGNITLSTDRLSLGGTPTITGTGMGTLTVVPYTAATTIGISEGSGTLSLPATLFSTYINDGFSDITVGNSTAGAITVGGATTINSNLTLYSANNITLDGSLSSPAYQVTLRGGNGSTVSGSGNITANSLLLNGSGTTYTLNTASANAVNTIAATGVTSINFKNSGSLSIDVVTGTQGVTATGNITLEANGANSDLTLNYPVTSSSTGNIVLAAGQNFINNTTSNTGIIPTSGRYFVYSTTPVSSTEGMTVYSKHYNAPYVAGSTPSYASSGNWFLYSVAPFIGVTPSNPQIISAGRTPVSFIPSYTTGLIDDDTITIADISGTVMFGIDGTNGTSGVYGAGTHTVSYMGGLSSAIGYQFQDDPSSANALTVMPDVTTTTSGVQSGTNGTANTEQSSRSSTDNTSISPRIVPGAGSDSIAAVSNNNLVTTTVIGMQLVTPDSTTPISYTNQGQQLSLNLSSSSTSTLVSSNTLSIYKADGAGFIAQNAVKVSDQGNRLTIVPANASTQSITLSDIQATKQVTSNIKSSDGQSMKISVSITKDDLLVISMPETLFINMDQKHVLLLGIATARESLGVSVNSLRGVVVKTEDLDL
jgi:fibronectin-binding autotransporter adhesin